jgi:hypothetical protein
MHITITTTVESQPVLLARIYHHGPTFHPGAGAFLGHSAFSVGICNASNNKDNGNDNDNIKAAAITDAKNHITINIDHSCCWSTLCRCREIVFAEASQEERSKKEKVQQ